MKRANIADLKNRLSHYLRFVRAGETVVVYDRDRAIARLDPVAGPAALGGVESGAAELVATGGLRAPSARLKAGWLKRRPPMKAKVVAALLEDRRSSR